MIPEINEDVEIVTERIFHYPSTMVFEAWANPTHLQNWWGPAGFTNTFQEFDFRIGGKWNFIMHGPEKGNYVNQCEFTDIKSAEIIAWKRFSQPLFNVLVTFENLSINKTKVIFRQIFDSKEACQKIKKHVLDKNQEVFDRLEHELAFIKNKHDV